MTMRLLHCLCTVNFRFQMEIFYATSTRIRDMQPITLPLSHHTHERDPT